MTRRLFAITAAGLGLAGEYLGVAGRRPESAGKVLGSVTGDPPRDRDNAASHRDVSQERRGAVCELPGRFSRALQTNLRAAGTRLLSVTKTARDGRDFFRVRYKDLAGSPGMDVERGVEDRDRGEQKRK